MNTYNRIYDVVQKIPRGMVASYSQVAALAGNKRWVRVVGYALHALTEETAVQIPWHRVVRADGSMAFADIQRELLEAEGVEFLADRVIMEDYQWETPWV